MNKAARFFGPSAITATVLCVATSFAALIEGIADDRVTFSVYLAIWIIGWPIFFISASWTRLRFAIARKMLERREFIPHPRVESRKPQGALRQPIRIPRIAWSIVVGVVSVIAFAAVFVYYHSQRGSRALHDAANAVRSARTYQGEHVLGRQVETVSVACPDRFHIIFSPHAGPGDIQELIVVQYDIYARYTRGWEMRTMTYYRPEFDFCPKETGSNAIDLPRLLERYADQGVVDAGLGQWGNAACRLWKHYEGTRFEFSVCIDEKTHLPRGLQWKDGSWNFSAWNTPVTIEAPKY